MLLGKLMDIKNIETELANATLDPSASIRVVKLAGNDSLSVYAAEVAPQSKLNPHYHTRGIETYQLYSGIGIMKTGRILGQKVEWIEACSVKQGDCFIIPEGAVHQIVNDSKFPLRLVFSCPVSHMGSDRIFVSE